LFFKSYSKGQSVTKMPLATELSLFDTVIIIIGGLFFYHLVFGRIFATVRAAAVDYFWSRLLPFE